MKKKYAAALLAAVMLSGCAMPEVSFENANSSLFVKKDENAADISSVVKDEDNIEATDDSGKADVFDESGVPEGKDSSASVSESVSESMSEPGYDKSGNAGRTDSKVDQAVREDSKISDGKTSDRKAADKKAAAATQQLSIKVVKESNRSYDNSSYDVLSTVEYTWLQLTEDSAESCPILEKTLDKYETSLRKLMAEEFEKLKNEAEGTTGKKGQIYSVERNMIPVLHDSAVFSAYTVVKEKRGEESGTTLSCMNVDSQTGREIALGDMIDIKSISALLDKAYAEIYPDDPISGFKGSHAGYSEADYVWTVTREGLAFYFVADKDGSVVTVPVLRNGNEDIFTEIYADIAKACIVPIGKDVYVFDKSEDGKADLVSVRLAESENSVTVTLNGKSAVGRFQVYAITPVLVRTEKERYYIYVSCLSDSDYQQLAVFDITDDTPVFLGIVPNAGFPIRFDSDLQATIVTLPGEPNEFLLDEDMNLLSTYSASRLYGIGEDGMPVAKSGWLYPEREIELTVVNSFYADVVDTRTDEIKKEGVKVARETTLSIFRTDGKSIVDLKTKDGEVFRVDVDTSGGWPQTIDGTDIQKLFDGTIFAG